MTTFTWIVALLSLYGTVLNLRDLHAIRLTHMVPWVIVDGWYGVYAQAALHACYGALSVYGLWAWRKGEA